MGIQIRYICDGCNYVEVKVVGEKPPEWHLEKVFVTVCTGGLDNKVMEGKFDLCDKCRKILLGHCTPTSWPREPLQPVPWVDAKGMEHYEAPANPHITTAVKRAHLDEGYDHSAQWHADKLRDLRALDR